MIELIIAVIDAIMQLFVKLIELIIRMMAAILQLVVKLLELIIAAIGAIMQLVVKLIELIIAMIDAIIQLVVKLIELIEGAIGSNESWSKFYHGLWMGAGGVIGSTESMATRGIEDKCLSNISMAVTSFYHMIYSAYEWFNFPGSFLESYPFMMDSFRHLYDFIFAIVLLSMSECHLTFDFGKFLD